MRMERALTPARAAAQHCAELVARGPRPEERAALLAAWRRDVGQVLAQELAALLPGEPIEVRVSEPEWLAGSEAIARIAPVAANCLLRCGTGGETALLSCDFATALALTERSFGGEGLVTGPGPDPLPRSATLLIDELATMTAQALSKASAGDAGSAQAAAGEVMMRSESAGRLRPFGTDEPAVLFTLAITSGRQHRWALALTLAAERFERLLPETGTQRGAGRPGQAGAARRAAVPAPARIAGTALGSIPLPLRVVLAEFDLPLARLHRLAPGDHLPLALTRQVPVLIGGAPFGQGHIGTIEDRMAIRLAPPAGHSFQQGPVS